MSVCCLFVFVTCQSSPFLTLPRPSRFSRKIGTPQNAFVGQRDFFGGLPVVLRLPQAWFKIAKEERGGRPFASVHFCEERTGFEPHDFIASQSRVGEACKWRMLHVGRCITWCIDTTIQIHARITLGVVLMQHICSILYIFMFDLRNIINTNAFFNAWLTRLMNAKGFGAKTHKKN